MVACGDGEPPYDFPTTRKGNPKVGQFCFQDYPDPPTQSYTVDAISPDECHASGACSCAVFAAHAVVLDASSCDDAIVYGTMRGDGTFGHGGDIYAIDLVSKTATWLFGTGLTPGDQNQPNGNAYDAPNHRLYYSANGVEGGTPSSLYFYDFAGTQTGVGQLTGFVVGAAFYNGRYYYIPNGTDDLWAVSFLANGTMASNDLVLADFTGTKVYRFGDIAISTGGILYASTNGTSGSTAELFQIDLGTGPYTKICGTETAGCAHSLQLAFGSDGTLYAHSAGTGEFFTVAANGVGTSIGSTTGSDTNQYTDLASGQLCFPRVETAWGDGIDFPGNNWATYFQCGDCP